MVDRIVRAIRLDWTVFREIAKDENAMSQAAIIVIIVAIMSSLGAALGSGSFFVTLIVSLLLAIFVNWIGWAILTYFVGSVLFKGKSDIPEMMRVLGYANAPYLLGFFAYIRDNMVTLNGNFELLLQFILWWNRNFYYTAIDRNGYTRLNILQHIVGHQYQ